MPVVTKSERVNLVATRRQLAAWRMCADSEGVSLSEWLRRAAERRIVTAPPTENRAEFEGKPAAA